MRRYKMATQTDTLRYKIAKEVFGEIEDCDGIRDIPSWEIFEKCLEQHKQIKDLKAKLAEKDRKIKGLGLYSKNVIDFAVEQLEKLQIELNQDLNPVDIYVLGVIEKHIKDLKEKINW